MEVCQYKHIIIHLQYVVVGIPQIYEYSQGDNNNIMVMQFLGPSLEKLVHSLPQKIMTVPTVCMVGIQIVNIMESIHNQHYIHRDIKPDNFVIGIGNENTKLYIIDFGLGKLYRNPITKKHNPYSVTTKLIGTVRYASVNSLQGTEQSRRDDLESVAYVLIYLLKGKLPWQGLVAKRKEDKYLKVLEKKKELTPKELCMGLPTQIKKFLIYVKSLEYEEQPNYQLMVHLLEECFNDYNTQIGDDDVNEHKPFMFDWIKKNKKCLTNIKESNSLKLQMKLEEHITPTTTKPVKYATPDRVPTRKDIKQNGEDVSETEKRTAINNYIKPKNVIFKRSNITTQSKKEKDSVNKEQTLIATVACSKTTQIPNYKKVSSNTIGLIQQKTTPHTNEVNMNNNKTNSNNHNHKKGMCVSKCCIMF